MHKYTIIFTAFAENNNKKETLPHQLYNRPLGIFTSEMLKYQNIGIFLGLKTFDMFLGHDLKCERHPIDDDDENVVG